jgi:hypothetical protein
MLRKSFLVVAALLLIPTFAKADFQQGNWELTLSGAGSSNKGITQGSFAINGSIGYFLTKDLELALRQSVGYQDFNAGTTITASTRGAVDWHFDLGNWKPFIGGNVGYSYGSHHVEDTWEVAPEAGLKYFLNSTTFIYGMAEYQIFFHHGHGAAFDKGAFVYSVGLGLVLK